MQVKRLILALSMIFISVLLYSEEEQIIFKKPEPYTDYEFEELQRTYLKQRKIKLASLEKLPLNQYPEEFILELINMIKSDIRKDMYKEFSKYKKEILNLRPSDMKDVVISKEKEKERKDLFDTSKIITYNQNVEDKTKESRKDIIKEKIKEDKRIDNINKTEIEDKKTKIDDKKTKRKDKKSDDTINRQDKTKVEDKNKIEQKIEQKEVKKDYSKDNIITTFSINGDDPFIGINYLSKLPIKIGIKFSPVVKFVDISFYVKSITDNMIYLIKRFPLSPAKNFYSFTWDSPNIPFGKYKPYIEVKFYDSNKNLISTSFQFWGNSSSNNIYVILKN